MMKIPESKGNALKRVPSEQREKMAGALIYSPGFDGHRQIWIYVLSQILNELGYKVYIAGNMEQKVSNSFYINELRKRGSYAEGETKPSFVYKVHGGVNNTNTTSADMIVDETDVLNPMFPSGPGFDPFVDWMLEEKARETFGELLRWEDLVRTGTLYARAKLYNPDAKNIEEFHKLRPIPNSFIDRILPKPAMNEIQNPGYY